MKKVRNFKHIVDIIKRYNTIRLNKPHIIGILVNPQTWDQIIQDKVYIVKNLGISLHKGMPEGLISVFKAQVSPNNEKPIEIIKVKSFKDLEENGVREISLHPKTYKKLKKEGSIIMTHLFIHVEERTNNNMTKVIPGIIGNTNEVFRYYEGNTYSYIEDDTII